MTHPSDSAFPVDTSLSEKKFVTTGTTYPGLSKRELFAAMAMQGLLAKYTMNARTGQENFDVMAEASIAMSDALIAALNKVPQA